MNFEEFLAEFRASGGIAENVRLGQGQFGRGLFPVDPLKPARVFTPADLAIPTDAIAIRENKMVVKPGAVSDAAAHLFEMYQEHFGWSAGGSEQSRQAQAQWHELPSEIVASIESMGVLDYPDRRFLAPSDDACMFDYLLARIFARQGEPIVVPVVDLVNYSNDVSPYVSDGGFGVAGIFADEMLVRYSLVDAFSLQLSYGFSTLTNFAYSIGITVSLPGGRQLTVGRNTEGDARAGVILPKIEAQGNAVHLGHLKLGNLAAPDLPRSIFREVFASFGPPAQADEIFDLIARFNRTRFIGFLRALRKYEGPLVRALENAALNQLETLSACVGARAF